MKLPIFPVLLFLLVLNACGDQLPTASNASNDSAINVMAYYVPEKVFEPEKLRLDKLTHIIFSFTNVIDGEMKFRNPKSGDKLRALVAQKALYPDLKVMVACGGWGADGFSDMALTRESRAKFVESVGRFMEKYQIDGLDMDWEYPGMPGPGIKYRPEDRTHFTLLMKALREKLDSFPNPKVLTFASAGWERYYQFIELNEVMKYVDYMNVMTYDQVSPSHPFTAHHTALGLIREEDLKQHPIDTFFQSRKEAMAKRGFKVTPRSVEKIIDYCLDQGVNPDQLVAGAAFYGRAWKGVPPQNNGLYQPNGGVHIGWVSYHYIRDSFEQDANYKRYWDSVAQAPYLYSEADSIFVSYDDTISVKLKTQYAREKGLGGIMFWQLGDDTKKAGSLIDAIGKEVGK